LEIEAVILNFDIEIAAEYLMEPPGQFDGVLDPVLEDELAEFAGGAAAQADDALGVGTEQLHVDARDEVIAFEEGDGRHLDEVLEALAILCQQREMVAGLATTTGTAVAARRGCDIGFVADHRVEAGLFALLVELDGTVEVAVVGHGDGVHAELL